jgi:hypothetical protein
MLELKHNEIINVGYIVVPAMDFKNNLHHYKSSVKFISEKNRAAQVQIHC